MKKEILEGLTYFSNRRDPEDNIFIEALENIRSRHEIDFGLVPTSGPVTLWLRYSHHCPAHYGPTAVRYALTYLLKNGRKTTSS